MQIKGSSDDYDCEDINNCFAVLTDIICISFVAGGLAVAEYFSGRINKSFKECLLPQMAGIYADTSIYGQGLLDLDAATSLLENYQLL